MSLGTESCAMLCVICMLWWGPNLAWQPVPHVWEWWIFFHHALRRQVNPTIYLSSAAPAWYLAYFDSSVFQMFCIWLWSGTRYREPGHPCQHCVLMQRSSKRIQKPWSRWHYGLMCCHCTSLCLLTALMSQGCRWKSQSYMGPTKAPLFEVHRHRCVTSLGQHLAAFLVRGINSRCGCSTGHILQHLDGILYLRLGCNSRAN